jgi:hypothetical protein
MTPKLVQTYGKKDKPAGTSIFGRNSDTAGTAGTAIPKSAGQGRDMQGQAGTRHRIRRGTDTGHPLWVSLLSLCRMADHQQETN